MNDGLLGDYREEMVFDKEGEGVCLGLVGNVKEGLGRGMEFGFGMWGVGRYENGVDRVEMYMGDLMENRLESEMVVVGADICFEMV